MNEIKAQSDILKLALKGKYEAAFYRSEDGKTVCYGCGYFLFIEDSKRCGIDFSHLEGIVNYSEDSIKSFFKDEPTASPIVKSKLILDTGVKTSISGKNKGQATMFYTEDKKEIYINTNFLKYCDSEATFKVNSKHTTVYFYEFGKLKGILMTINPKTVKKE